MPHKMLPGSNANTHKSLENKFIALVHGTEHLYIFTSGKAKKNPFPLSAQLSKAEDLL